MRMAYCNASWPIKTAQCIVGNDAGKEFVCFLLIPIFVGYYTLFVLVCHGIKTGLKVR